MKFQNFLYFIFFLPFFAGCQTSGSDPLAFNENAPPTSSGKQEFVSKPTVAQVDNESVPNDDVLITNILKFSDKNKESVAAVQNEKPLSRYGIVKFKDDDEDVTDVNGDEIVDSEDLSSVDNAVLENAPENFQFDPSSSDKINPLMCNEGLFYSSWVSQFDREWNAKYSKNYKRVSDKNKALSQARTNEFIRLVYPAIEKTGYDFPVVINPQVLSWIAYFTGAGRKNFVVWLERGQTFIPEMQKTLEQNGLPSDLVYLSMIESGYSTKSLSNVGAVGLWQFMPATAREYGLKINDWLDERRDVVKSTQAASQYLSALYTRFGSWHLAAAGYNGGPGLVSKTLRNYGQDSSFFELTSKKRINSQTANYVPKILAAMIVAKNPALFGFDSTESSTVNQVKTISVTRSIALADLAESIHVDKAVLENLNPQLRLGITPPPKAITGGKYNLLVPASKVDIALASLDKLPDAPTNRLVAARIKHLEKVSAFAKRYKINVASLLKSNSNLKATSSLRKGQVVYISVTLGSGQYDNLTTVKYNHHKHKKVAHNQKSRKGKHHSVTQNKKQKPTRVAFASK
ncbi:MAG: transglycosylase SLT domain-containing protein [Bdellovibrionota bacterium]